MTHSFDANYGYGPKRNLVPSLITDRKNKNPGTVRKIRPAVRTVAPLLRKVLRYIPFPFLRDVIRTQD